MLRIDVERKDNDTSSPADWHAEASNKPIISLPRSLKALQNFQGKAAVDFDWIPIS